MADAKAIALRPLWPKPNLAARGLGPTRPTQENFTKRGVAAELGVWRNYEVRNGKGVTSSAICTTASLYHLPKPSHSSTFLRDMTPEKGKAQLGVCQKRGSQAGDVLCFGQSRSD